VTRKPPALSIRPPGPVGNSYRDQCPAGWLISEYGRYGSRSSRQRGSFGSIWSAIFSASSRVLPIICIAAVMLPSLTFSRVS